MEEKPHDALSELQLAFNNYLYEGSAGSSTEIPYYVLFNDENGVGSISHTHFENARTKKIEMRTVKSGDTTILIRPDFDKKGSTSQMRKLLVDFLKAGIPEFDPNGLDPNGKQNLLDRQRFGFTIDGGEDEMRLICDRISPFFQRMWEEPIHTDHGQNPTVSRRYYGVYKNIPVEILFFDVVGHLNDKNHIGIKNPKTGLYTGSAHSLYEIRRATALLPFLFPHEVYASPGQSKEDYDAELMNFPIIRSEEVAGSLRKHTR